MAADLYSKAPTEIGAVEVVRFIKDHGYRHIFGLPGSQLAPAFYELQNIDVEFVPSIHESVTLAAADGYSRVNGSAVCLLYMLPGVSNAMANLYNAYRDDSPVIIIASQQLSTARTDLGAFCEGNTAEIARPLTRLSKELTKGTPVRSWLEKAKRIAEGPPGGPVLLSITEDVFVEPGPVPEERMSVRGLPGIPDVSEVAKRLRQAERPLIVVGGQLRRYGGSEIVEKLCETFEIPVAIEGGFNSALGVAPGHSHCIGGIAQKFESQCDMVLMLGCRYMSEASPRAKPYYKQASFLAQVNVDIEKLETTRTVDYAVAADPGAFAKALFEELQKDPPSSALLESRKAWVNDRPEMPLPPGALGNLFAGFKRVLAPLHDAMDRGWVVDESVMAGPFLIQTLQAKDGRRFASGGGASLGWATGAAVGIALASGEPVTIVIGDGSLRFGALGLWSIAALKLPITIIVLDNHGYASTRNYERQYIESRGHTASPQRPGYYNMDMRDLGPDIADMVRGFGIPTRKLTEEDDLRTAVEQAWAESANGPNCLIMPVGFEDHEH